MSTPPLASQAPKPTVPVLRAFASACLKNSEYDLVNGAHANAYIDFDELYGTRTGDQPGGASEQPHAEQLLRSLIDLIKWINRDGSVKALAFVERDTGPVGLLSARHLLSQETGLASLIVRPRKRIPHFAVKGGKLSVSDKVLLLTDVSTTGRTLADAAAPLWYTGAQIVGAVPLVDRNQGAREYLEALDIALYPLTMLSELQALLPTH